MLTPTALGFATGGLLLYMVTGKLPGTVVCCTIAALLELIELFN